MTYDVLRRTGAGLLLGALLAGCGSGQTTADQAPVPATGRLEFSAELSGHEEVPGPGVPDGSGVASLTFEGGRLCYELRATVGERPTAVRIHNGEAGTKGALVTELKPSFEMGEAAWEASSCLPVGGTLVDQIKAEPGRFYVNVHTKEHPDGAVRGQLRQGSV